MNNKYLILNLKLKFLFALAFLPLFFSMQSCEDLAPTDYVPSNFVEGYLIVGEPIQNIKLMKSQPINDSLDYAKSLIRDAEVWVKGDGQEFPLIIAQNGTNGYYSPNSDYKVKSNTKYDLLIRLKDGTEITSSTTTPPQIDWKVEGTRSYALGDYLQFPFDSLSAKATDTIAWSKIPSYDYYLVIVKALDTTNYGKYLANPTGEKNRRIERSFKNDRVFKELTTWSIIPNTKTPVVWSVFNWYGKHEVAVYCTDYAMTKWFLQSRTSREYNPLLGSVKNAMGCFGSASVTRDTCVLLKNQP